MNSHENYQPYSDYRDPLASYAPPVDPAQAERDAEIDSAVGGELIEFIDIPATIGADAPADPAGLSAAPGAPLTRAQIRAAEMDAEIERCRIMVTENIPEPLPRLFLAGKPVATQENLVAIVAKAGSGKSAAVGAAYAATVAAAIGASADTLGFTAENVHGHAVVVIDTEQSRFDAQLCLKRAVRRASTDVAPEWLENYSLVGKSRQWRRAALRRILAQAAARHGGIFAVYLDGCADLVTNVNDIDECIAVVAELRQLSIEFRCPIINVIHSNEGSVSDKARGHIGSELIRESETVILLKKEGDSTVMTTYKQRKAPVKASDGVAFTWSEVDKRHISCVSPVVAKQTAKEDGLRELALTAFGTNQSLRRGELEDAVKLAANVSINTAVRRVDDMVSARIITKGPTGLYNRPLGR